jgi:hypothetical protein
MLIGIIFIFVQQKIHKNYCYLACFFTLFTDSNQEAKKYATLIMISINTITMATTATINNIPLKISSSFLCFFKITLIDTSSNVNVIPIFIVK